MLRRTWGLAELTRRVASKQHSRVLGPTAFVQQWVVDHLVEYDGRYYPPPRSAGFRVRWQGYAAKHDTWEPASELSGDLKLEFWRDLQKRHQSGTRRMSPAEGVACRVFMKQAAH